VRRMANDRPLALVTGASAGIGAAYAEQLATDHDLVLVARRRDRLQALADRLGREHGAKAQVLAADLTDRTARAEVEARAAEVDLLINNAGFGGYQPFTQLPPRTADELLEIHVHAVVRLCRAALPPMIQRGRGGIINVASLLALSGTLPPTPMPHRAVYGAGKAFQLAFTQLLAGELATAGVTGVRLQCCLPGVVATEFHSVQGMDLSRMPRMSAADVATASLRALARGELVCIPGLEDPALFDAIAEDQRKTLQNSAQRPALAERYRSPGG
jgi:uncharacterized protein